LNVILRQFPDIYIELIDAEEEFLKELKGVTCPETKRKKIGHLFIKLFVQAWDKLKEKLPKEESQNAFLLQGTLYPDLVESVSPDGIENTIKSHHNVGGLPKEMNLELLEPLRYLFKGYFFQ
jgi:GMP synthase (glutamine-hydrolysing)